MLRTKTKNDTNNRKKKMTTKFTKMASVWLLALVAMAAIVIGEDAPDQAQAQVLSAEVEAEQDYVETEAVGTSSVQSITFKKDQAINDALRFLTLKYQRNIVPSPNIMGNITVTSLYNVT
ncbi:hypothetical protein LCGC14_2906360, partial [marine sediment metagenome]